MKTFQQNTPSLPTTRSGPMLAMDSIQRLDCSRLPFPVCTGSAPVSIVLEMQTALLELVHINKEVDFLKCQVLSKLTGHSILPALGNGT